MKRTTLEDLTGQIFNYLLVESRAASRPKSDGKFRTMWNCKCLACGKETVVSASELKANKRISCGCMFSELTSKRRLHDYTGQVVGRLFVKSRAEDKIKPSGGKIVQWNCVCQCGTHCVKSGDYLSKSPTPSCGCWKREITSKLKQKDLTGNIYGYVFVIEQIKKRHRTTGGNIKVKYTCGCLNCGRVFVTTGDALVNGSVKSCGCIKSFGELAVRKALLERNVRFTTQYHFRDLYVTNAKYPLLFDFAIMDDSDNLLFLLEYQGIQHYTDGDFGRQQREVTDSMKKDYCHAHGIILYEIKYDEIVPEAINRILTAHANFVPSLIEKVRKV